MQESTIFNNQFTNSGGEQQYVTFSIDDEEFGVEILKVQEIIGYTKPTHVPNAPECVSGVINLRGIIIPVIDLRKKFAMPLVEYNKFTVVVVVEVSSKIMGIIVDAVSDVLSLSEKDIQEAPDFSKFKTEFLKGMGKIDEKLVVILDIDKLLSFEEYNRIADIT